MLKYKHFIITSSHSENDINKFLVQNNITKDKIIFIGSEMGRFVLLYDENL